MLVATLFVDLLLAPLDARLARIKLTHSDVDARDLGHHIGDVLIEDGHFRPKAVDAAFHVPNIILHRCHIRAYRSQRFQYEVASFHASLLPVSVHATTFRQWS